MDVSHVISESKILAIHYLNLLSERVSFEFLLGKNRVDE